MTKIMDKELKRQLKEALKSELTPLLIGVRNDLKSILAGVLDTGKDNVKFRIAENGEAIPVIRGAKGDPGTDGKDAVIDYELVLKEALKRIEKKIPAPRRGRPGANGRDGKTPVKGVDYRDGRDGKDGTDGKTIIKEKSLTGDEIIDLISNVGLPASIVSGLEKVIQKIVANLRPWQAGGFGGAGTTAISLSTLASLVLLPTETVDGSRTVFTFAGATKQPTFVIRDNAITPPTSSASTVNWTWNNLTKQVTFTLPPQDDASAIQ